MTHPIVLDHMPPGVTVEGEMIDPDTAAAMLIHNTHNRNLRKTFRERYVVDMRNGDWNYTGQPITFGADGTLLDGQNRLSALIEANVTLPFVVIRGLPNAAQEVMDSGAPRKFFDVLKLRGEGHAELLASAIRRIAAWERGTRRSLNNKVTSYAILSRTLEAHPEVRDLLAPGKRVSRQIGLTPASTVFSWWLFASIDAEDAEFFFSRLADGQALTKGDPIFELRRTLAASSASHGQRDESYLLAITIKAWNAYRNGEQVGLYRWRPGGAKPEQFPEPR